MGDAVTAEDNRGKAARDPPMDAAAGAVEEVARVVAHRP
jgi:hypothetical protein